MTFPITPWAAQLNGKTGPDAQSCSVCGTALSSWQHWNAALNVFLCNVCWLWEGAGSAKIWGVRGSLQATIAAPSVPTLTPGSSGSMATATYICKMTWASATGETVGTSSGGQAVTGPSGSIAVTVPAFPAGVTQAKIYCTAAAGAAGTESFIGAFTNSAGGTFTITVAGTGVNGAPTVSTMGGAQLPIQSPGQQAPQDLQQSLPINVLVG
jgi:hypothetical protein